MVILNSIFPLFCLIALGILLNRFKITTGVFFALPTSTAIYVLSAQLNSDTELASAAIMVSTVLSFIPLSVALLL